MGKLNKLSSMLSTIKKVLKISYSIEKRLFTLYYITSFLVGLLPVLTAYMMKLLLDNILYHHHCQLVRR